MKLDLESIQIMNYDQVFRKTELLRKKLVHDHLHISSMWVQNLIQFCPSSILWCYNYQQTQKINQTHSSFHFLKCPFWLTEQWKVEGRTRSLAQRCFLQGILNLISVSGTHFPIETWKEKKKLSLTNQCYNSKSGSACLSASQKRINLFLAILCSLFFQLEDIKVLLRVLKDKHFMW